VTAGAFASAMKECQGVVGAEWVFTSDEDVDTYRDAYSPLWGEPNEYMPSAALAPDTVEQVQALVRIANRYKFPLYPVSTGKNLAYGGSAPSYPGSVVLDLKRMNRILNVDDKRNFALLEPGVSYFDLYQYIQEHGLKVWIDCPDPGWGSPVGNALDHGVGYTASPFRDHFGSHCGMEVVTPTGEVIRTGMGALPNGDSWQDYRYGVGPWVDGLFGQGNFGIVTKMGFWLFPQPETMGTATATVPRWGDMASLIEVLNYLEDSMLMTGMQDWSSPVGGGFGPPTPEFSALMANGWPTDEQVESYVRSRGRPAWQVQLHFYGPEKTVRANCEHAQERLTQAIPGATFKLDEVLKLPPTPEQARAHEAEPHVDHLGVPNMITFNIVSRRPNDPDPPQGHMDMFVVSPRTAKGIMQINRIVYDTQRQLGLPTTASPFSGPIHWYHRSYMMFGITSPTYRNDTPDRAAKNRRTRQVYETAVKNLGAAGFGLYRTALGMQDLLVNQYSFGNHALRRFHETMKDAVDPNGVVAPGRYGVWPKRLRDQRRPNGVDAPSAALTKDEEVRA
jgi:4-cresol dehydrogenase (hydroxylating)